MKHSMRLNDGPFNSIKGGTKSIELRLNDEKRSLIKKNDLIEFTNIKTLEKIIVKVVEVYKFSSFDELYKMFDKTILGYGVNDIADPKDMEQYYSKEEQEQYGVVGIEILK